MTSRTARTPVRVNRHHARTHRREWAVAGLAMFGMFAFLLVLQPLAAASVRERPSLAVRLVDLRWETAAPPQIERMARLGPNLTAVDALQELGASRDDARNAIAALRKASGLGTSAFVQNTPLTAWFAPSPDHGGRMALTSVSVRFDPLKTGMATRQGDGQFMATTLTARVRTAERFATGIAGTSIDAALRASNAGDDQIRTFHSLFPESLNASAAARPSDRFEVLMDIVEDEHGAFLEPGDIQYASYAGINGYKSWYMFTPADTNEPGYYLADGTAREPLINRYPIGRVPISSKFGMRIHPVSGKPLLHRGTDFSAPEGAQVLAASGGRIESMKTVDGYGQVIRIEHSKGYETLYAHLKSYARGLRPGQIVRKGDVIGYVGETGTATGPHLHFEIHKDGDFLDPMDLSIPPKRILSEDPEIMRAFRTRMAEIDAARQPETLETTLPAPPRAP